MSNSIVPFFQDADVDAARPFAEKLASSGVHAKAIGKEVLACLENGGLPATTYEKLARMCHNKNVDHRRNMELARELSKTLFGRVVDPTA